MRERVLPDRPTTRRAQAPPATTPATTLPPSLEIDGLHDLDDLRQSKGYRLPDQPMLMQLAGRGGYRLHLHWYRRPA